MKAILVMLLFLLVACSPTPPRPPSNESIAIWFEEHYQQLEELKEIGIKQTALRRSEPDLRNYTDYYRTPTEEERVAEERTFEILDQIGVDFVSYSRSHPEFIDLISMEVPVYLWGISLGGYSVTINYIDDSNLIKKFEEYMDPFSSL